MPSWYLELAAGEGLDPKRVICSLAKAITSSAKQGDVFHMGKSISSLEEPLLRVREFAELLNVSEETVRRYAREKVFSTVDIPGGVIRFHRQTILDELNSFRRSSRFSG